MRVYRSSPDCPESRDTHKSGDSLYRSIYRHIDYFLPVALENDYDTLFTVREIIEKLDHVTGVKYQSSTLERYRKRLFDKVGESPLCKAGGRYKLNPCYYRYLKIKPPRPRKYKIQL